MLIVQYSEVYTVSLILFPKNLLSSYSFFVTLGPTYRATEYECKIKDAIVILKM